MTTSSLWQEVGGVERNNAEGTESHQELPHSQEGRFQVRRRHQPAQSVTRILIEGERDRRACLAEPAAQAKV